MGTTLHRLARTCARRARLVVALWLLLLAALGTAAATLSEPTSDSFTIPGTEAFEANDRLGAAFPGAEGATGQVVLAGPALDPALLTSTAAALRQVPQVAAAADPVEAGAVSADGTVAYVDVQLSVPFEQVEESTREAVAAAVQPARDAGLQVEVGGEGLAEPAAESHLGEVLGFAVAAVALAVALGGVVAAGLPLLTALVGVGAGLAAVSALTAVVELSSTAPTLALMLGLAVGIDYALFVLARYQQELARGVPRADAVALATATAGSAVVFAGGTVVIALAGLAVVGIPFLTQMGLAAAGTVALAVLIALTLVPALLTLAGSRIGPRRRAVATPPRSRWAGGIVRRPVLALVVPVLALGALAVPVLDLELGLPGAESQSTDNSARRAYDLVARGFGPGANGPLLVLVEGPQAQASAEALAADLEGLPGAAAVVPPLPSQDGRAALLTVVPASGPAEPATADLVERLRDRAQGVDGARIAVTGTSAVNIDISAKLAGALPVYVALVVGLALVLLLLVFRSVLVPVKAVLGFLLTLAATGGAVVAVFQKGWGAGLLGVETSGSIISFLPVLLVGIIFGLAMDYQVFLVTRMRERHVHGAPAAEAVERGFTDSARVVVAAAVIMIAVFSGFVLSPDPVIKSIGFALALGVALDAFVVRMTVVPAVLVLLGDRAWRLPRWLDRLVPRVDVEGEAVARTAPEPDLATARG